MLKKSLSILLAVLFAAGCLTVCAGAVDADEPVKTDSGYYVGQIIKPGDKITSVHETCEMLTVGYSVGSADAENVSSALQKAYASEAFVGLVSFRDSIASFSSGEEYAGTYTVKGPGEEVNEMETENGVYKTASDIYNALDKEVREKMEKRKKEIVLTIDFDYAKTTYYQYTTITEWEVVYVSESDNSLNVRLQAVFETREPNEKEAVVEKIYSAWQAFLDMLGDTLLQIVPKVIAFFAEFLGNNK